MTYKVVAWDDTPRTSKKKTKVHGVCIHATGKTRPGKGIRRGRDPNAYTAEYYDERGNAFPNDMVTWRFWLDKRAFSAGRSRAVADFPRTPSGYWEYEGYPDIVTIAPWWVRSWAQGLNREARSIYTRLDDHDDPAWPHWVKHKKDGFIDLGEVQEQYVWWWDRWPHASSPLQLFPGHDPNLRYLSIEVVVPVRVTDGGMIRLPFTRRQHDVAAWRAVQMFREHELPADFFEARARVVGHEDLHPIGRTDRHGPWDPGAGRWWNWGWFYESFVNCWNAAPAEPNSGPAPHD